MATQQNSSISTQHSTIETAQSITIPMVAKLVHGAYAEFQIATDNGTINVMFGSRRAELRGTPEAIIGFGLILPEWMPGLPGNNATTQTVGFDAGTPHLYFGKRRNGTNKRSPRESRINIRVWGAVARTVEVVAPLSPEQIARLERFVEQHRETGEQHNDCLTFRKRAAEVPDGKRTQAADQLDPRDPDELCIMQARIHGSANRALDVVRDQLAPGGGVRFSKDSEARILRLVDELRRAFAEGLVVAEQPMYEQRGNVVCWPGRGRVGPVVPGAIQ